MEKRFLYFFFVMFLFLLVWSFLFPQQPQSPTVESKADSVSVQAPSDSDIDRSSGLPVTTPLLFDPADSIEAAPAISIGNFFITYSPTGGYIRSLSIESEANPLVYKNIGFSAAHANTVFSAATTDQAIIFTSASGERKEFIFDQYIVTVKVSSALRSPLIAFSSYKVEDPIDQRYQEVFFQ